MKPNLQGETERTWAIINTWQVNEEGEKWALKTEMNANRVPEEDTVTQNAEADVAANVKWPSDIKGRVVKSLLSLIVWLKKGSL